MVVDYLETMRNFTKVNVENDELKNLIASDLQFLLKAKVHVNKQLSQIAGFIIKKYIETFPLLLLNYDIFVTLIDCI